MVLGLTLPVTAQHKTTLYDSTSVVMEESGLSHVINHQRERANDFEGCRDLGSHTPCLPMARMTSTFLPCGDISMTLCPSGATIR